MSPSDPDEPYHPMPADDPYREGAGARSGNAPEEGAEAERPAPEPHRADPPEVPDERPYAPARPTLLGLLVLLLLAALGPLAVWWVRPPAPLGAEAPAGRFSAARALSHLEWIAAEPRPTPSPRNDAVRARLVDELEALGLEVELQEGTLPGSSDASGAPLVLRNVLARLPGEADASGGRTKLLLSAHYDSVAGAPGAGDDGAAVAALLETLRALGEDPPRRHDLCVLITDGEELDLLGARLFVAEAHPWLQEVGAVLNFEARGAGGPSVMFQVGPRSDALVRAYADAVDHPTATSLSPAVYERLPNDTDFSVYSEAGLAGLNFAFIGGGRAYHGAGDTVEALDAGSLQHHGEAMLALARALADTQPSELGSGLPQEYLLLRGLRLSMPRILTVPLTVAVALAALALVAARARGGAAQVRAGPGRALLGALGALVVGGLGAAAAYYGAFAVHAVLDASGLGPEAEPGSNFAAGERLAAGAWIASVGAVLLVVALVGRGRVRERAARRLDALGAGALLLLAAGAVALALSVPGAGYVGLLSASSALLTVYLCAPPRPRTDGLVAASQPRPDPSAGGLRGLVALVLYAPAAVALLPLFALFVQVGSREPVQERVFAAATAGLACLAALPLFAVVGARRERLAGVLLLAALVVLGLYAWSDLAVAT